MAFGVAAMLERPPKAGAGLAGQPGGALIDRPLPARTVGRAGQGRIAQLVEQLTLNQRVVGSNPTAPTKFPESFQQINEMVALVSITLGIA